MLSIPGGTRTLNCPTFVELRSDFRLSYGDIAAAERIELSFMGSEPIGLPLTYTAIIRLIKFDESNGEPGDRTRISFQNGRFPSDCCTGWATTALFVLLWYLFFLILFKTNFAPTIGFEPIHPLGLLPVFKAGSLPVRIKWAYEVSEGFEPTNSRFAVCRLKPLALRYQKQELMESNPYHPGWSRRSYH